MSAPESLQAFQWSLGKHLRNPDIVPCPTAIPHRRVHIYQELLFNNVKGFINNCFPVSKQVIEAAVWQSLIRDFFAQWRCHTPYFSEIPQEFLAFLTSRPDTSQLPPWLLSLLHYEWIELDVELQTVELQTEANDITPTATGDFPFRQHNMLRVNPTVRNLVYEWPVHRISGHHLPKEPAPVCLVVYRDGNDRVQFMEVNPVTARMLALIESGTHDADTLLDALLAELQHPNPVQVRQFGRQQIDDFIHQGIVMEGS